jgi:hypothetical protein
MTIGHDGDMVKGKGKLRQVPGLLEGFILQIVEPHHDGDLSSRYNPCHNLKIGIPGKDRNTG